MIFQFTDVDDCPISKAHLVSSFYCSINVCIRADNEWGFASQLQSHCMSSIVRGCTSVQQKSRSPSQAQSKAGIVPAVLEVQHDWEKAAKSKILSPGTMCSAACFMMILPISVLPVNASCTCTPPVRYTPIHSEHPCRSLCCR